MKFEEGVTISMKDIYANVLLAARSLSAEKRIRIEKLLAAMPDSKKEPVSAADLNRRWDEIWKVVNE